MKAQYREVKKGIENLCLFYLDERIVREMFYRGGKVSAAVMRGLPLVRGES